jgi:hypothetical protein
MIRLHAPLLAIVAMALLSVFPMAAVRADDTSPHPRAALVIGNGAYTDLNPATSAANDGHDMCQALTSLGYSAACFEDVKDAREFKARIQDFTSSLKPGSEVVFYYAGHAIQVKGENYLVPTSARPRSEVDVPKEMISLAYIMTQLLQGKHYLNIVILDACRGAAWPGGAHGMTAGLAPITTIPRGTMVMYATAPIDFSEQRSARNGVLTKHLLANIATPGLTADEFFRKVSEDMQGDSGDAATGAQSAALYTNFTGEFCFGGCIDKVARAELEKIEKENEEQLEQTRKQRAELEARKREAQAKLLEMAISSNCDRSVLGDSGRCFTATPEAVTKAVVTAFTQRGFMRPDGAAVSGAGPDSWWVSADVTGDEPLWAMRITDNAMDKNVSDIVRISATQRNVTSIGRCVVTLSATRRTVLHDEFHTWGAITIVPVATSKQYRDVVKNEVDITDSAFYLDLLAAIERNVRGINAGLGQAVDGATAPTAKETEQLSDHVRRYDAPPDRTQRALIAALVSQGYLVRSVHPEFGSIDLFRRLQDPKDKHSSINSTLTASVTTPETGAGSQAQLSGDEVVVAYIEPGGTMMGTLSGDRHAKHESYETRLVHESAVTDASFYRGLLAGAEAGLRGEPVPSKHSQRLSGSAAEVLSRTAEVLPQHGFEVTGRDERLGILQISKRTATPLSGNDGWTAHYVEATVYADSGVTNETVVYVAASSQDAIFHAAKTVSYAFLIGARYHSSAVRDCRAKKCTIEELEARFAGAVGTGPRSLETLTHEGDADAAAYGEILSIVSQKPSSAGH